MDIKTIHHQQKLFFDTHQTKNVNFRIEQLLKLKKVLKENENLLYDAVFDDFGKSKTEVYMTELGLMYHEIDFFVKKIKKWNTPKKVATGLSNLPAKSYIISEPYGVALIIGAWNYPYQLSLLPAITALAAGNTVVLKPSELAQQTSKIMAKLVNKNFSSDFFRVVEGGVSETTEILNHKFDIIFFTGSSYVGKIVYQAAAKYLTPVVLELGGKSPAFVFEDCDIKLTAKRLVWAKFLNAGQTCIAPDYILVEKSVEEKLLEALKQEIIEHYDEQFLQKEYSKIINTKNYDRLVSLIDKNKIYYGGKGDREKRRLEPTILKNVFFNDKVMSEEIFGPILPVISFSNIDEAILQVKTLEKPLSCYIYSKSKKNSKKVIKEISFGGGAINDSMMHVANSNLPFGGVGASGMGNYHGKAGFDTFSHQKSILEKSFWFELNVKYSPYTDTKRNILKWMLE